MICNCITFSYALVDFIAVTLEHTCFVIILTLFRGKRRYSFAIGWQLTNHSSANIGAFLKAVQPLSHRADILFCPAQMGAKKLQGKQMEVPWRL